MNLGPALATTAPTVGPYLVEKVRSLNVRLADIVPRVLASTSDEDAVHDLRVALRRLRTVLEVGRRVFGRFHADEVRRSFRDVQRATGLLRDEEVFLALVVSLGVTHPGVAAWLDLRRAREKRLRQTLARIIRLGELDHGRRMLDALLAFRVKPSRDKRLTKFARRAVDRVRRGVERRRTARLDDVESLHELRVNYKRLRYTVETFGDVLPSDLAALGQPAARMQSRLGDLHDVDIAISCVLRARALSHDARRELLAALSHFRDDRVASYAKELRITIAPAPPPHEVGTAGLRKISTR